jgi:hypothetical protein
LNLQNKTNLTLKKHLVTSCVEIVGPNNPIEIESSLGDGKTKPIA